MEIGKLKPITKGVKRYRRLKAAGLCVACGRNPASDGYVRCKECRERYKDIVVRRPQWETDYDESKKIFVYIMALLAGYADMHKRQKINISMDEMRKCFQALQGGRINVL